MMEKSEKLNQQMIELQMLDLQLRQLEEKARMIEQQIYGHQLTEMCLDEIKGRKNEEVMIPLGPGLFMAGKIENMDRIIIHLGSKILAKKKTEDAKKLLQKQRQKLMKEGDKISIEMQKILSEMSGLESRMKSKHEHSCSNPECDECRH